MIMFKNIKAAARDCQSGQGPIASSGGNDVTSFGNLAPSRVWSVSRAVQEAARQKPAA